MLLSGPCPSCVARGKWWFSFLTLGGPGGMSGCVSTFWPVSGSLAYLIQLPLVHWLSGSIPFPRSPSCGPSAAQCVFSGSSGTGPGFSGSAAWRFYLLLSHTPLAASTGIFYGGCGRGGPFCPVNHSCPGGCTACESRRRSSLWGLRAERRGGWDPCTPSRC